MRSRTPKSTIQIYISMDLNIAKQRLAGNHPFVVPLFLYPLAPWCSIPGELTEKPSGSTPMPTPPPTGTTMSAAALRRPSAPPTTGCFLHLFRQPIPHPPPNPKSGGETLALVLFTSFQLVSVWGGVFCSFKTSKPYQGLPLVPSPIQKGL